MRVRVSHSGFVRDLVLFLGDCGCVVEHASDAEVDVTAAAAQDERAARVEVGAYLSVWHVLQTGATAKIL